MGLVKILGPDVEGGRAGASGLYIVFDNARFTGAPFAGNEYESTFFVRVSYLFNNALSGHMAPAYRI